RGLDRIVVHARPDRADLRVHVGNVGMLRWIPVARGAGLSRMATRREVPRRPPHLPQALHQRVGPELRVVPRVARIRADSLALDREGSSKPARVAGVIDYYRDALAPSVVVVRYRSHVAGGGCALVERRQGDTFVAADRLRPAVPVAGLDD